MCGKITDLDEYIKKIEDLNYKGCSTFRGQCCSSWFLEPGIIRRIKKTYTGINEIAESGLLFSLSLNSTMDLLKSTKSNKHFKQEECDLKFLEVLQHYGAATPLLDFTNDPWVALYFACQPSENNGVESDGKVFSINYPDQIRSPDLPMRIVTDPFKINIETDLYPNNNRGIWFWNIYEDHNCKRSEKQKSVFVFGWGLYWGYNTKKLIEELEEVVISAHSKQYILKRLEQEHDISKEKLFVDEETQPFNNDLYDFAQSNSHDKIIQYFSAEDFYNKGEEDSSHDWAAQYYKMAYTKRPDWIDARCKCALFLNRDGEQSEALKVIEDSIKELGEKWKLLVCKAIINEVIKNEWKADLKKAEEIANNENEGVTFKQYLKNYGRSIFRLRFPL